MKESVKIGRGTFYILFGKIFLVFLGFLYVSLVPRILGPENMGFYSYWFSIFIIIAVILDLGGSSALARYIPELRERNQDSIRPLIEKTIGIKFPFILLILFVGLFLVSKGKPYFLIIFVASIYACIESIIQITLYSYNHMGKYALITLSRILARLILVIVLFILFGSIGILLGILGAAIIVPMVFGLFAIKLLPKTSGSLDRPFREYLTFGLFVYLGILFFNLTNWSVVILSKNYISDMAVIGFLGLGLQICFVAIVEIVSSVGESVLPSLIEFHVTYDKKLKESLELNWKYTNLILFPLIFGLFILARPAISIVVGEEFLPTVVLIELLLPATVFISWALIHQQILLIYEKKKEIFVTQLIGFMVFLISGVVLIEDIGITGAPISLSLGTFAGFICIYFLSLKIIKIHSYSRHIFKPFIASVGMGVTLSFIEVTNPTYLLGAAILGGSIYLLMMLLIKGIIRTDIERVKDVFK